GTSLQLYIIPPFWQTWWFYSLTGTLLLLMLYGIYRWRTRQLHQQRKNLAILVKERTEEVEAQKESLSIHASHLEVANTKIKLKNKKIMRQARKLKTIDRLKSQFLTNISHEFRTPLTLILNPLEEMISKGAANPEINGQLSIMNRNARRLLQLINQLLDLSKIESGNMPLQLKQQDIVQHLKSIAFSFDNLAKKHKINYSFNSEEKEIITTFDTDKFEKIIYNLLSNAFKYTPDEGTIHIHIETEYIHKKSLEDTSENKFIKIKISDSGIGITSEHLPFIFNRFYQGDPSLSRKTEGTGIGLSLTKELVEIHGGEISVESNPGQGTCFTILFPIKKISSSNISAPDHFVQDYILPDTAEDFEFTSEKFNTSEMENVPLLLIVEDNDDLRQLIKRIFSNHFRVEEAINGIEGWHKTIEFIPDLIISDVMMPHKDGLALCHQIKNDAKTCHIPTILLTAKTNGEEVGLSIGADDYITKPFNAKVLVLKVKNLLNSRLRLRDHIRSELGNLSTKSEVVPDCIHHKDQLFLEEATQIATKYLIDPDFDMETLYRELGMSRTLVYKKLKSLTGLGPNEFVRQIRLNKAAQLLLEKNSVTEVMHQVGFNHRSYFINCFKKQFNATPSEYALGKNIIKQT
ncbi:MAG: ATP-binding protein, partial [Bacteroidota bacterium]|nr:ATP-binding protein [Bacteroidota bacterium]